MGHDVILPTDASAAGLARTSPAMASRVPALDVLRGVAVLAVFVRHLGDRFRPLILAESARFLPAPILSWLRWALERTHWGVDLFFVLSGFTLGMGFVREHAAPRHRMVKGFFARRAARILPGFYLALAVHLAFRPYLLGHALLAQALGCHAILLQGYWAPGLITIIGASWSLTTESHFYLLAPWFARWLLGPATREEGPADAAHRGPKSERRLTRVLVAVGACCLGVWVLRGLLHDLAIAPGARPGMLELTQRKLVFCRADQFFLGMGAAVMHGLWLPRGVSARTPIGLGLSLCGLSALAVAVPLDAWTWGTRGGNPAYALVSIGMTLLVLGAALLPGPMARPLGPLRALGVVSYGVFLYHQLTLELAERWIPGAAGVSFLALGLTTAGGLGLAWIAGAASFYLVETPVLDFVSRRLREAARVPRAPIRRTSPCLVPNPKTEVSAWCGASADSLDSLRRGGEARAAPPKQG